MEVKYNVTGTERWELAHTVAALTGEETKYKGTPTFAYQVGPFTVTRYGTLEIPDEINSDLVDKVLDGISRAGFESEEPEKKEMETEDSGIEEQGESFRLTISIPSEKVNVNNLKKLLESKGDLIKKALGISDLPVEVNEDEVSFPWFSEMPDADSVKAYMHFISELCRMSKEQSRINSTSTTVENEKYAFRCFLLRLGFIGTEYKAERKILLKNLSGSCAFKDGVKNADAE